MHISVQSKINQGNLAYLKIRWNTQKLGLGFQPLGVHAHVYSTSNSIGMVYRRTTIKHH